PASILKVADGLPELIVVADEAYLDFSATPSLAAEATRRPNLVVLKTLSKAYGLAGARVGCAIGDAELIAIAARALPPYPLPSLSIEAAMAALAPSRRAVHEERIERIKAERDRLASLLPQSPMVKFVRNGGGDFILRSHARPGCGAWRFQPGAELRRRSRDRSPPQHRGLRDRARRRVGEGAWSEARHLPLRLCAADGRGRGAGADRPFGTAIL